LTSMEKMGLIRKILGIERHDLTMSRQRKMVFRLTASRHGRN
jgi:hypothetical protein